MKKSWQKQLSDSQPSLVALLNQLDLSDYISRYDDKHHFSLRVTQSFINRMKKADIEDPLLRQVLPSLEEFIQIDGFTEDPVGDLKANKIPGLLHKYKNRVLLSLTGACAIHCRYCFRREFPYAKNNPGRDGWKTVIDYIKEHSDIDEVIYSGGDPLVLSDDSLTELTQQIAEISHVKRLRIHSRLPIVLPDRITESFINAITSTRLFITMVIHCNHANEIDADVSLALETLHKANIFLLNQSVLLKGVNDSVSALKNLSAKLIENQVSPYYLHLLDKVKGTAHFDVPEEVAKQLMRTLSEEVPGYFLPRLVAEIAGEKSKRIIY
jgi:EF-P beta-lysylation protein EpmB